MPCSNGFNLSHYIAAHHLLHAQIRRQSNAFVAGFRSLVPPEWLRVFAPAELRLLICGAGGGVVLHALVFFFSSVFIRECLIIEYPVHN